MPLFCLRVQFFPLDSASSSSEFSSRPGNPSMNDVLRSLHLPGVSCLGGTPFSVCIRWKVLPLGVSYRSYALRRKSSPRGSQAARSASWKLSVATPYPATFFPGRSRSSAFVAASLPATAPKSRGILSGVPHLRGEWEEAGGVHPQELDRGSAERVDVGCEFPDAVREVLAVNAPLLVLAKQRHR